MVQAIISRMASNSSTLKAISGTLTAAIIAYAATVPKEPSNVLIAGIFPIVVFWLMDAQYLRQERLFRKLYEGVRSGEIQEPFSMDFKRYDEDVDKLIPIAMTWSTFWYYLALVSGLAAIAIFN